MSGFFCTRETGLNQFLQLRYSFEQVSDQTVIGYLEDRRFFILVDRNDHFGIFHTGQVLDRAGDTDSDVQLRGCLLYTSPSPRD